MPNLKSIIQRLRAGDASSDDWLYICGDAEDLSLATEADLGCPEFDEDADEEITPPGFEDRGLWVTIDKETVDQCIAWGDRLAGKQGDAAAADVIRYYVRFDDWSETLNAPEPLPSSDASLRLHREFRDSLGAEDPARPCRHEGCSRGSVKFSVLCRRHHFEKVRGCPYPFAD